MNKQIFSILFAALLLAGGSFAHAGPHVSDRFLEERVSEEIAEEGLSLARLGLRVVIHQRKQGGARVEIADESSGRIVRVRLVERLAKEPEARVAALTMVASALLRESSGGGLKSAEKDTSAVLGVLRDSKGVFSPWAIAMEPAAILARHRPSSVHVIAMPTKSLDKETRDAATQLVRSYQASGVSRVQGPGRARSSDALEVVKAFASSSADELALVSLRRYDGTLRAMITFYNKRGEVLTAMTLTAGVALETTHQDGVALPDDAMSAIGTIKGSRSAALKEYERERIVLNNIVYAMNGYIGNVRMAQKGVLGGPLEGAAFYRAVGREDYAQRFDSVSRKKRRGYWIAGTGMLGVISFGSWAGTMALISAADDSSDYNWQLPTVLTAISTGVMVGGYWYSSSQGEAHAEDEAGRIRLAEAYNERLRGRLGLSEEETSTIEDTMLRYNLQLQPYATETGGGLGVGGSF